MNDRSSAPPTVAGWFCCNWLRMVEHRKFLCLETLVWTGQMYLVPDLTTWSGGLLTEFMLSGTNS